MFDLDLLTDTDPFEIDTQSTVIRPPNTLPTSTGETDDTSDDARRRIRVLRPSGKSAAPRSQPTPTHRHRARAVSCRSPRTGPRSRRGRGSVSLVLDPPRRRNRIRSPGLSAAETTQRKPLRISPTTCTPRQSGAVPALPLGHRAEVARLPGRRARYPNRRPLVSCGNYIPGL